MELSQTDSLEFLCELLQYRSSIDVTATLPGEHTSLLAVFLTPNCIRGSIFTPQNFGPSIFVIQLPEYRLRIFSWKKKLRSAVSFFALISIN